MLKNKKSTHINIDADDHSHFKVQCVKRDLSMQEVFAAFARRVGMESSDMMRFLDQIANSKSVHSIKKKYTISDIDSIYSIIEEDNTHED